MKRLKSKVFLTIFTILTVFLLTILFIFNFQDYRREKSNVVNNLNRMVDGPELEINRKNGFEDIGEIKDFTNDRNKKFIDATIYTVTINNDKIDEIISHTEDGSIKDNVEKTALNIIAKNNEDVIYIGNLYTNDYSYKYVKGQYIILIDNSESNTKLCASLKVSILIGLLGEVIIFVISELLSKWIIKPVEESFNKQKQFIADASHELKTPLSVIMASSEALEKDNDKKWLNNIQSESERMSKLIKDLLDLAKLDNEKVRKEYELINLSKLTEKSILTLESLMYEKHIKLDYKIADDIYLKCNSDEIKQLMAILLDNAIKHSEDQGKIIVNLTKSKDIITLEIKNKGLPIPKGEEDKIFERFYRVDNSRNRNENRYGLGLAIAKEIVTNDNGEIKAFSNDGYTTFKVTFKSAR